MLKKLLGRLARYFSLLPTPADLWDLKARGLRKDGFTEKQIVAALGLRPKEIDE